MQMNNGQAKVDPKSVLLHQKNLLKWIYSLYCNPGYCASKSDKAKKLAIFIMIQDPKP